MNLFDPRIYWERRLAENPGILGVGLTSLGKNYNEWLYKVRRHTFLREIRSLPFDWETARVLDVGSGTGFYIRLWQEAGIPSVTGSDLTQTSVDRLRQGFPGKEVLQLHIGGDEGLPTRKFDAISAFDVLFHIIEDRRYEAAISNIYGMLEPNGLFIFSDNFLHRDADRATHQVSRSLAQITDVLRKVGFRILRRRPMFALMNVPVDTQRWIWQSCWNAVAYPVKRSEFLGFVVGASLYPVEMALTRMLHEGPSTELMICQKL